MSAPGPVTDTRRAVPLRRAGAWLGGVLLRWSLVLLVLVLWEITTRATRSVFFPPPSQILSNIWHTWLNGPPLHLFLSGTAVDNLLPSLGRVLLAWLASSAIGIAAGIGLGRSPVARDYVGPLLTFFRAIPPPVLVPVFIVVLDLGAPMQLATMIFGVLWPVLLNAIDGARSVHPVQRETALVFRIPRPLWIFQVVLPAAMPKIFAGLRSSLSIALVLMVVSELAGATNGVGYRLNQASSVFDYPQVWGIIVLLGALGWLLNSLLLLVQSRALAWQPPSRTDP